MYKYGEYHRLFEFMLITRLFVIRLPDRSFTHSIIYYVIFPPYFLHLPYCFAIQNIS